MPYPNTTASVIVISQTSGSSIGGQFPFIERQISGSNLFLITDASGNLTGSTNIPGGSFTNLIVTGALTASIISASNAITAAAITSGPITASNISASGNISASVFVGAHTGSTFGTASWANNALTASSLVTANSYQVTNLTASGNITASGTISSSAINSTGTSTFGNIVVGNMSVNGNIGPVSNITATGFVSSSNFVGPHTGSTFGTASWANNALTASSLVLGNSYAITNLTASNISASGNITASGVNVSGTLTIVGNTVASTITGALSGSSIATGNATINGGAINNTTIGSTTPSTGNFTNLTASNISSSGAISGSNGWFANLSVPGVLTATISGSITTANSSSVANNNTSTLQYITFVDGTGNRPTYIDQDGLTYVPSTNTLSASGAVSASAFNASGNVAVNGGEITTNALTFSLATANATTINVGTVGAQQINVGGASAQTNIPGLISNSNATAATVVGNGAITTAGGIYVGKNLIVSGSTTLLGDVTMFGTGSIINISSSNIIIGDNRIQLNAWSVGAPQRYGGVDIFDSGSSAAVTSSILWDSLNNYWLLQTNQTGSGPIVTSSAIILQGPTSSFGSEFLLTVNNFLKVQTATGNMITSSLSEVGNTLQYAGTISASVVTGSRVFSPTGSFINLNVFTGSSPGVGNVPATPNDPGLPGQIEVDNNFIYIYTSNVWKRVPVSVWTA